MKLRLRLFALLGVALCAVAGAFYVGVLVGRYRLPGYRLVMELQELRHELFRKKEQGFWRPFPGKGDRPDLAALPYLQGYRRACSLKGVVRRDPRRSWPGHNLVVSGHAPEAVLLDMQGKVLHRWRKTLREIWPEPLGFREDEVHKTFWRRARLLPDGSLLAVFEGIGLVKLDRDSRILWAWKGRPHHHLVVDGRGRILVLTRKLRSRPDLSRHILSFKPPGPILEDFIAVLSPDGRLLKEVSILDCFLRSDYRGCLELIKLETDVFHTNTLQLLEGRFSDRLPMFQAGRVLISLYGIHTVAVVDLEEEKVVWALTGLWRYQHEPMLVPPGRLLVFDNYARRDASRLLEVDPLTQAVTWRYEGGKEHPFFSATCGALQRLPNGNLLVTESEAGRAFELTRGGDIVWEYWSPYRTGEGGELIAVLLQVERVDPEACQPFWQH